jgi:membrane protease subunit HflC
VRIKGIELPASTSNAIYQRMRADMQKIANKHRADGQAAAEKIRAKADADVMVLLAQTRSNAQKIRSVGQAQAAEIYAQAYSKNKDFFTLYRSLIAYENSFKSKRDIFVLDQSNAFFNYFKQAIPNNDGMPAKK